MDYDFKAGKKRIEEILNSNMELVSSNSVPNDNEFTFDNAYSSSATAIFVDIRDSTQLFSQNDKVDTAKIIRCFTSEIIDILLGGNYKPREIGIRGDCVYAIFSSGSKKIDWEIFQKGEYINTYMKMLNNFLCENNYSKIEIGIGISTSKELVIKAGRKGKNVNDLVWIGKCVSQASKYSGYGNKKYQKSMVVSKTIHDNIIESLKRNNPDKKESEINSWFTFYKAAELEDYYICDIVKSDFSKWIEEGMVDEDER